MSRENLLHTLFHLILIKTLRYKYSFPKFADKETETQSLSDLPKVIQPGAGIPRPWICVSRFQAQDSFCDGQAAKQTCHFGPPGAKLPLNCPSKQKHFSKAEVPPAWRVTAGAWLCSQWPLSSPAWVLSFQGPGTVHCNHSDSLSCSVRSLLFHTDLFCEHSTASNQWAAPGKPLLYANRTVSLQTPTKTDRVQQPDSETQSGPGQSLNHSLERSKPVKQKPGVVCHLQDPR